MSLKTDNFSHIPLADRVRPQTSDQFVGQEHLIGKDKPLRLMIEKGQIFSLIFWGPPGSGKTTLARIIAQATNSNFAEHSATASGVAQVRQVVAEARERLKGYAQKTILFIDEIHRFSKAQQDAFLPHVENGTITLIGATTENPSFEVIPPLLSRCRVLVLKPLTEEHLRQIITQALDDQPNGLGKLKKTLSEEAFDFLIKQAAGDARIALNALEVAATLISQKKTITLSDIEEAYQHKALLYDKGGEEHYNTISSYIKSMRASNIDAALYYLARMVEAGEDPLFIARRMVIFASEDIGMAQPTALVVANDVFRACEIIGYPECQLNLAHGTVYLAGCKKDRSSTNAFGEAMADVKKYGNLPIPLHLRNAPTKLMKDLGYAKDYKWSKDYVGPTTDKSLLPEELEGRKYYKKH